MSSSPPTSFDPAALAAMSQMLQLMQNANASSPTGAGNVSNTSNTSVAMQPAPPIDPEVFAGLKRTAKHLKVLVRKTIVRLETVEVDNEKTENTIEDLDIKQANTWEHITSLLDRVTKLELWEDDDDDEPEGVSQLRKRRRISATEELDSEDDAENQSTRFITRKHAKLSPEQESVKDDVRAKIFAEMEILTGRTKGVFPWDKPLPAIDTSLDPLSSDPAPQPAPVDDHWRINFVNGVLAGMNQRLTDSASQTVFEMCWDAMKPEQRECCKDNIFFVGTTAVHCDDLKFLAKDILWGWIRRWKINSDPETKAKNKKQNGKNRRNQRRKTKQKQREAIADVVMAELGIDVKPLVVLEAQCAEVSARGSSADEEEIKVHKANLKAAKKGSGKAWERVRPGFRALVISELYRHLDAKAAKCNEDECGAEAAMADWIDFGHVDSRPPKTKMFASMFDNEWKLHYALSSGKELAVKKEDFAKIQELREYLALRREGEAGADEE